MRVVITGINSSATKHMMVGFSSPLGNGEAIWHGVPSGATPDLDREYDAEIEIPEVVEWGKQIKTSELRVAQIVQTRTVVKLIGRLESVEEDGYAVIRIGNSLFHLETKGGPLPIGVFVEVSTKQLELYDTNLL